MGHVAHRTVGPGSPIARMDRLVVSSTVAQRILIVWIYNNAGKSVFAAILFHAMSNLGWQMFPNHGSHYDPRITGLILAFAAAVVTALWGPRTLARYRNA
jgi:membrane protease YdiL (CAAX protease family)